MQPDEDAKQDKVGGQSSVHASPDDDVNESAEEAASETAPDTHPVFGNDIQPQEIFDEERVGTKEDSDPFKGENTVVNYDPENDARVQDPPPEED